MIGKTRKKFKIKNHTTLITLWSIIFIILILILPSPINSLFSDKISTSKKMILGNLAVDIRNLKIYENSSDLSNAIIPDNNHETGIIINPNNIKLFTFEVANVGLAGIKSDLYIDINFNSVLKESGIILLYPSNISDTDIINSLKLGNDDDAIIKLNANDTTPITSSKGTFNGISQKIDTKKLDSSLTNGVTGIATIPGESSHFYEYKIVLYDTQELNHVYSFSELEINIRVEAKLHNVDSDSWEDTDSDRFKLNISKLLGEPTNNTNFMHPEINGVATNYQTVYFGNHEWKVLDNGKIGSADNIGSLVLLSKQGIGTSKFNWDIGTSSHLYENSVIEEFVENWEVANLSNLEKESIIGQKVTEADGSGNARAIEDKINGKKLFLLSAEEAANWGSDPLSSILPSAYFPSGNVDRSLGNVRWWLRSKSRATPSYAGYYASAVSVVDVTDVYVEAGGINGTGNYIGAEYVVRPATKLDLNKILFASPVIGANTKTSIAQGNLTHLPDNFSSVKTTLIDNTRKLRINDSTYGIASEGGVINANITVGNTINLTVDNSNTTTGVDNYISALIKYDSNNDSVEELYYTKLQVVGSSIVIPSGNLPVGVYRIQLFSEKVNTVDTETDYASDPITLLLTVNS